MGTLRAVASTGLLVLILTACGSGLPSVPPPDSSAGSSPPASIQPDPNAWLRVSPADIEQPFGFETAHTDANGNPIAGCAPCHPAVDTTMTGVTDGPAGPVAVGWIFQGFHGEAWHEVGGSTWMMDGQLAENSILAAVTADERRYVAVGLDGQGATAWSSTDGVRWQKTESHAFATTPLRLTAIAHGPAGFVASGFAGNEFGSATAAFWRSADGIDWERADGSAAFADARPTSVAAGGPGFVAVGTTGPASEPGPAAVWTSPDGRRWTRHPADPAFADARLRSVANVPGIGIVAVGENLAGDKGVVWTSPDGLTWTRAAVSPYRGSVGIQLRMNAVVAGGPGAVIVGTSTAGIQYGQAVVWTSADGATWDEQPSGAEFADGELNAVAAAGGDLIAVGDRGAPDAYVATVWTGPPSWSR